MPFFSIVTVVLNGREELERTADSLARQIMADFEWRIVDGGSTDGTYELAQTLGARFPALHATSGPDKGLYDAMNKGLRVAEGDYVIFMNAGDLLAADDVLAGLRAELEREDNIDILFGGTILRFPHRDIVRPTKPPSYVWHGQPGMHQATAYRTAFHRRHEYTTKLRVTADYECLSRMVVAGARMKSIELLVSINEIVPNAVSIRHQSVTMKECYRTQRDILGVPLWKRLVSYARRALAGGLTKRLAGLEPQAR